MPSAIIRGGQSARLFKELKVLKDFNEESGTSNVPDIFVYVFQN